MPVRSFSGDNDQPNFAARSMRAVTPDDDADLPNGPCKALLVAADGDLEIVAQEDEGAGALTIPVVAGQYILVRVRRVMEATTATVVALY